MNKIFIKLIKLYQKTAPNRQRRCRFQPTCSNYALAVFEKFGFSKALILSVWRILRCNPLIKGGYNPPPYNKVEKFYFNLINTKKNLLIFSRSPLKGS